MTEDRTSNFSKPDEKSHQQAMDTAVRILAHRDHSKYELKQKLRQRGFENRDIDAVIAECKRLDYINDRRTARIYILQLKRKCFGKRYIQMALKKKRLGGAAIEQILPENYLDADERENAGKLLDKKRKAFEREPDDKKRRNKMYRFLYSRGFGKEVIAELIRDFVK